MNFKKLFIAIVICMISCGILFVSCLPSPFQIGCKTTCGNELNTSKHSYQYSIQLWVVNEKDIISSKIFDYTPTRESQKILDEWIEYNQTKWYWIAPYVNIPSITLIIKEINGCATNIIFNDDKIWQGTYNRRVTEKDKAIINILKKFQKKNGIANPF